MVEVGTVFCENRKDNIGYLPRAFQRDEPDL